MYQELDVMIKNFDTRYVNTVIVVDSSCELPDWDGEDLVREWYTDAVDEAATALVRLNVLDGVPKIVMMTEHQVMDALAPSGCGAPVVANPLLIIHHNLDDETAKRQHFFEHLQNEHHRNNPGELQRLNILPLSDAPIHLFAAADRIRSVEFQERLVGNLLLNAPPPGRVKLSVQAPLFQP